MKEFVNDSSQAERKAMLKNDQAQTYFERAAETIGSEVGGRFAHMAKTTVEAVPSVPRQPENSPWSGDQTGVEPPLGYDINSMVPTGTPSEIAASIAAELQTAIEEGAQVARAKDVLPDDGPMKRRY